MANEITRRKLLHSVGSGALGLSLAQLLRADDSLKPHGKPAPKAERLVVLMLNGGPSHLDMWDMKPSAPAGVRGEFNPQASSLASVPVCEHLPKLARHMHRCTLVRSMHHSVNNSHAQAVYTAMTGHDRGDVNVIVGNSGGDHPAPGAMLAHFRPGPSDAVPHVALPYKTKEGAGGPPQPGFFGGILGQAYDPLWVLKDPSAADFAVPELTPPADLPGERIAGRGKLLGAFNQALAGPNQPQFTAVGKFQRQALDLLTSSRTRKAFRLEEEPTSARDAYGRNIYGQSVLLARRMLEAGTRVATISWAPDANATWDTHGGNFKKLKGTLLPQFDAAFSALLTDLSERGMLDSTLVAVIGDFGRTPKINNNDGGRDHWNYCYTILLAGGGVKPGFVFGASDKTGAFPADRPVTPGDLSATVYHLLGVAPQQEIHDAFGRPHRVVPKGDVIRDLLA